MVLVDKKERSCKANEFAVPGDSRIEEKEKDMKTWEGSYRRYGMLSSCRVFRCYTLTVW